MLHLPILYTYVKGEYPKSEPESSKPKKLLDQLREAIRFKHYSYATEKTHVYWAKRYILFHNKRHPAEMGVMNFVDPVFLKWQ